MEQGARQIVGRLGALILVGATALIVAGCGSSESTPTQDAEAEYRSLNAEARQLGKQAQAKSDSAQAAIDDVLALLERQKEAVLEDDIDTYRELQPEIKAAEAKQRGLEREATALQRRAGAIERKLSAAGGKIEAQKGCDRACRRTRKAAIEQQLQCMKEGQPIGVCQKRYPIPRYEILRDVLTDDE